MVSDWSLVASDGMAGTVMDDVLIVMSGVDAVMHVRVDLGVNDIVEVSDVMLALESVRRGVRLAQIDILDGGVVVLFIEVTSLGSMMGRRVVVILVQRLFMVHHHVVGWELASVSIVIVHLEDKVAILNVNLARHEER